MTAAVAPLVVPPRLRSTWRLGRVPLIEPLLGARIVPREWPLGRVDGVIGWGRKKTGVRALALSRRLGLPCLLAEDGFLRSIALGHAEAALSIVLDDVGVHYDAGAPSRLEALVRAGHDAAQTARARALAAAWCAGRVSKYNHAREAPGLLAEGDVLVVDQTAGDESIVYGSANARSFRRMLEAALDEHPRSRIVLKVHPDVISGRKRGHFDDLAAGASSRVALLATDTHPPSLLQAAQAVYVVTSQMGFEALLWGKPVRCFGMPFYAGWGLTGDELPAPRRRAPATFESLVHAALVEYPRYLDPETLQRCEPERLLDWMALQRRQRERFPAEMVAVGFRARHRPLARIFLAGSRVSFAADTRRVPAGAGVATWGDAAAVGSNARTHVRVFEGLLRRPGVAHADAASWLMDRCGNPHDAQQRSELEDLLAQHVFDAPLLQRARRLRERLSATRHVDQQRPAAGGRSTVLVLGEPGCDPLPLLRAVRAEAGAAELVFVPDPAGRAGAAARSLCDRVAGGEPPPRLLAEADAVHTLASPQGFQALLQGCRLVCHGAPFYAGWGLTEDRVALPRRGRRLALDELVAGALILYPTYVSRTSRRFTTPERVLDEMPSPATAARSWLGGLRHRLGLLGAGWRR